MYFLLSLKMLSLCHNFFTINIIKAILTGFFGEHFLCLYVIHAGLSTGCNLSTVQLFSHGTCFYGGLLTMLKCSGSFWGKLSSVSSLHVEYLQCTLREILMNSYFSGVFCYLKSLTVMKKLFLAPSRKSLSLTKPYSIPETMNTVFYRHLAFQG